MRGPQCSWPRTRSERRLVLRRRVVSRSPSGSWGRGNERAHGGVGLFVERSERERALLSWWTFPLWTLARVGQAIVGKPPGQRQRASAWNGNVQGLLEESARTSSRTDAGAGGAGG